MSLRWLVAKYTGNIERNEPDNIGLILLDGEDLVVARFMGEKSAGWIDGRSTRSVRSLDTYRLWVRHWRNSSGSDLVASALERSRDDNYFLEPGGELLIGAAGDPLDLFDQLYTRLVEDLAPPSTENIHRAAESVITKTEALLSHAITREALIEVPLADDAVDQVAFDYRYDNGRPHLMQRVSLAFGDGRSWDQVHAANWTFSIAQRMEDEAQFIALVRPRPDDNTADKQLRVLARHAHIVDLTAPDEAVQSLVEMFAD